MITATQVCQSLIDEGLASSFKKTKQKEYQYNTSSFDVASDNLQLFDETFGKESWLFLVCNSKEICKQTYYALKKVGGDPLLDWNGGAEKNSIRIRVSYFKGSRWWE